jgi:hypothetical protein
MKYKSVNPFLEIALPVCSGKLKSKEDRGQVESVPLKSSAGQRVGGESPPHGRSLPWGRTELTDRHYWESVVKGG